MKALSQRIYQVVIASLFSGIVSNSIWTSEALADDRSFQAHAGPVAIGIYLDPEGESQLMGGYSGYLYECHAPHFEVEPGVIHFIFHKGSETRVIAAPMGGECTSPWNYNAPTFAQFGSFESETDDAELWQLLRQVLVPGTGVPVTLEIAVERDGRWDSDHGNNYRMLFH